MRKKEEEFPWCFMFGKHRIKPSLLQDCSEPSNRNSALWLSEWRAGFSVGSALHAYRQERCSMNITRESRGDSIRALFPLSPKMTRASLLCSVSIVAFGCPHSTRFGHHERDAALCGLSANLCFLGVLQSQQEVPGGHCSELYRPAFPRWSSRRGRRWRGRIRATMQPRCLTQIPAFKFREQKKSGFQACVSANSEQGTKTKGTLGAKGTGCEALLRRDLGTWE